MRSLARSLLALAIAALAATAAAQEAKPRSAQRLPYAKLRSLRTTLTEAGQHRRIAPDQPTHWMQAFPEDHGETFEQFARRNPRPLADELTAFYVAPLPPAAGTPTTMMAAALAREFIAAATGLAARELQLELPAALPSNGHGQCNALPIVSELLPTAIDAAAKARGGPFADGAGFLAVTAQDLYYEDAATGERLNFLFGLAAERLPVVLLSTARLGDPTSPTGQRSRRRMATLAVHEFGHTMGLLHCTAFRCVMNGANDLGEADGAPLAFCPECLVKLWWRLGLEPKAHLQAMRMAMQNSALAPALAPEIGLLQRDLEVVAAALEARK